MNSMYKNKKIFSNIILFLCIILVLFSCTNNPKISNPTDKNEEISDFVTESIKQVTIGLEAYKNIDKSYLDELTSNHKDDVIASENDEFISDDDSFEDDDIAEGDELENGDEIEETSEIEESSDDIDETKESAKKTQRKRFIDIEYDTQDPIIEKKVYMNADLAFATYSEINTGYATLYIINKKVIANYKGKVVAVNAGHGTKGGSRKRTYSHPDFTPKVSGGSTKEGAIFSYAISDGTILLNGLQEATANLMVALALKEKLLSEGYSVLMMREDNDSRLDNIARVVIANEYADCHISIHFDSTDRDKGIFYVKPINNKKYLNMEPLKSNVDNINRLGTCLLDAFKERGEKLWKNVGILEGDLTQISYSTNASVDIELGDRATLMDATRADAFAEGLLLGIQKYFAMPES